MRDLERFQTKVDIRGSDQCWNWTASLDRKGYSHFRFGGRMQPAHRAAYELLVGPIPEGLTLDHLCRNKRCVNPSHLEPVTNRTNILRGDSPSAIAARRDHCLRGHAYTDANTYRPPQHPTWRMCRTCAREARREARMVDA